MQESYGRSFTSRRQLTHDPRRASYTLAHGRPAKSVIRRAYSIRLEPGALAEYREKHDNIWPELVEEFRRLGIARMTAFEADPIVFYYAEILDRDAFDRLWVSEIHDRWAETFTSLIAFGDDEQVDARFMSELFHLESVAA